MKGKIKFIQEKGEWSNSSGTFNKYQVQFDDGQSYQFLAKGQFKKQIGDMVDYEITNQQYGTAKLVYAQPQITPTQHTNTLNINKYDTGQSILRQVSFKGVIELICAGKINISEVEHYTNQFHSILNK